MQRRPLTGSQFGLLGHYFTVGDPDANVYIVNGVTRNDPVGNWRWTQVNPELRFLVPTREHLKFTADFTIPDVLLRDGPVTLSFFINGNELDRVRYDKAGEQHFEKPAPPEWLKAGAENRVVIETDKTWVADDGAKMGFLMIRAGFIE